MGVWHFHHFLWRAEKIHMNNKRPHNGQFDYCVNNLIKKIDEKNYLRQRARDTNLQKSIASTQLVSDRNQPSLVFQRIWIAIISIKYRFSVGNILLSQDLQANKQYQVSPFQTVLTIIKLTRRRLTGTNLNLSGLWVFYYWL